MSYAIGHIIYGINLGEGSPSIYDLVPDDAKDLFDEDPESLGIGLEYSGNGDPPIWLGVHLSRFDECENIPLDELLERAQVTDEAKAEFDDKVKWLKENYPKLHATIEANYGLEPQVWILWGSS